MGFWNKPERIIQWDIIDYYAYLPAFIIYDDVTLKFKEQDFNRFAGKIWGHKLDNGNYVIKMSMGMSVMYAPFFLCAHLFAHFSAHTPDGYTKPYAFVLVLASLTYFILGLLLLAKILIRYFPDKVVALVLLIIAIGTNVSNYLTREAPMSHSFSFFLFAAFIYLTIKWYEKLKWQWSLLLGLVFGLISLIRPTNSVIAIIFILWNIKNWSQIIGRFRYIWSSYRHFIIIGIFAMLVWFPQIIYWKYVTGSWIYYTYGDEGFFFSSPKILNVLFGFRKGWFVYTPLMFFAFCGFTVLYKKHKQLFCGLLLFFILNLYIVSSWWCWWYGGSYGHRALIESMAVMAFPLAAIVNIFSDKKIIYKVFLLIIVSFFIIHNLFQNYKYLNTSIHFDSMTGPAYFETIDKLYPTYEYQNLLRTPDYEYALKGLPERHLDKQ